jgi:putative toxin-antitoxin system antitoxin component (TIGR02293 family)
MNIVQEVVMTTASPFNHGNAARVFDPTLIQHAQQSFMDQMGLPRNPLKAHQMITEGLDVGIVERAATVLKATPLDVAQMVSIDRNTYRRREKAGSQLSVEQGARVYQVFEILDAVLQLFSGDVDAAMRWMYQPALALDDALPMEMLSTPAGCDAVLTLIGRLEHGVIV